jgi:uncharacterized protein (DUF362 family)
LNIVGITRSDYEGIHDSLPLAIERGGGLDLTDGQTVVIKINLCDFRLPETGAVTHPIFLEATLNYLRAKYKDLKIFVVESDATGARPDLLIKWLGFEPILSKYQATYVNLSKGDKVKKIVKGRHFKELSISKIFEDCNCFISMAKLKTHMITKVSCILKNQFGCLSYARKVNFHPKLDDVIIDANIAMKPHFCIVDGIIGMGGCKGPTDGIPLRFGTIITGKDPVAVDSACARILGFRPFFIGHIRKSQQSSLGHMKYKIVGDNVDDIGIDSEYSFVTSRILKIGLFFKDRAR